MRSLVTAAAAVLTLATALSSQNNVLVVIADDLGVDNVGVYAEGAAPPPTPNLDALAARGVLFRNAWSNPTCSPSRACFQTGRYSFRTGVGVAITTSNPNAGQLHAAEVTLPRHLDAAASGYAHALFGKWHLHATTTVATIVNDMGWSHYAGHLSGKLGNFYSWWRNVNGTSARSRVYATTKTVDDALAWISGQTGPWLSVVAFNAPHDPYHTPPASLHTQDLTGLDPAVTPIPFFKAMVEALDTELGRLLAGLGPALATTTVIFVADNGTAEPVSEPPFISEHAKGTPYEGGVNVPLIVAGPAVTAPGREEQALVHIVDLFATCAQLCGAPAQPQWVQTDGLSLLPYLQNPQQPPLRTTVFAEHFSGPVPSADGFVTVRDATYKSIRWLGPHAPPEEFYDLVADPFETVNLLPGPLTPTQQAAYDNLSGELDSIRIVTASITPYGSTGCIGSAGTPTISSTGSPQLGGSYTVSLAGAAAAQPALLMFGASDQQWNGYTLPLPLSLFGAGPGCLLYASAEWTFAFTTDASGAAAFTLPVPDLPTLLGTIVYHSWISRDPDAPNNPLGVISSDALKVVCGT